MIARGSPLEKARVVTKLFREDGWTEKYTVKWRAGVRLTMNLIVNV